MSYFVDSHCHLHPPWFNRTDLSNLKFEAKNSEVEKIVSCASDPKMFEFVLDSFEKNRLYCTLGLQPTLAHEVVDTSAIEVYLNNSKSRYKIKAIGEVGLDYHWIKDKALQKKQKELFLKSIEMSNEFDLPIVIHSRKAESDCLDLLEKHSKTTVLLHSFEGNMELINRSKDLGYLISIPTNVVIRKNRRKVAKRAGLDNIVIETDSPYCAPKQDQFPNTPASITIAAIKLSEILETPVDEIKRVTTINAEKFYQF